MPARSRKDRGRIARRIVASRWTPSLYPSRRDRHGSPSTRQPTGTTLQLSILLLAADRVSGEALTSALQRPGHGVTTVADPVDLFASAPGYNLVVIDQVPPPFTVAAVIEELRRDESTNALP